MKRMKMALKIVYILISIVLYGCAKENKNEGVDVVTSISLDQKKITLFKGGSTELSATVIPEDALDKTLTWSSSDESIVQVDQVTGRVEAMKEGAVKITVIARANGVKASCNVIVTSELNILFVGNSFTYDAVWWLPGLIHAAGIDNVNMAYMYLSSSALKQHVTGYNSNVGHTCYRAKPASSEWVVDNNIHTIKDVVKEREWNVVSIQEYTGRVASWGMTPDVKATIDQWINIVNSDQQGRPEFAYIMTQAFGNPDVIGPYRLMELLTNNFASQDAMYSAISLHAERVLSLTEIDRMIATGTTIQNLRASSLNTPLDLTRDGYHLDVGLGRYAGACTIFESLIVPYIDGATLDGNSFRISTTNEESPNYQTAVTNENVPIAIEAARNAVLKPFEVTPM